MSAALIAALRAGRQADPGGECVIVSRQAVEEAAGILSNLYALGLVIEEQGEVAQLIGKALRFGIDTPGPDGVSARDRLPDELGDVEAAVHFACLDGIAPFHRVIAARERKKTKLSNPESIDAQGNRLAPEPRGIR